MAQIDVKAMLEDPVMQMGLGIMANKSPTVASQVGGGLQGALGNLQVMEQRNINNQLAAGKLAIAARDDPTTKQKDYALYVQQTQAAGRTPLDFTTWDRANRQSGATTINTGGDVTLSPITDAMAERFNFTEEDRKNMLVNSKGEFVKIPRQSADLQRQTVLSTAISNNVTDLENLFATMSPQELDLSGLEGGIKAGLFSHLIKGGPLSGVVSSGLTTNQKKLAATYTEMIGNMRTYASGAAVPETEVSRDINIYVPKSGDTPEMIDWRIRKARERSNIISGMTTSSVADKNLTWKKMIAEDKAELSNIQSSVTNNNTQQGGSFTQGEDGIWRMQ